MPLTTTATITTTTTNDVEFELMTSTLSEFLSETHSSSRNAMVFFRRGGYFCPRWSLKLKLSLLLWFVITLVGSLRGSQKTSWRFLT